MSAELEGQPGRAHLLAMPPPPTHRPLALQILPALLPELGGIADAIAGLRAGGTVLELEDLAYAGQLLLVNLDVSLETIFAEAAALEIFGSKEWDAMRGGAWGVGLVGRRLGGKAGTCRSRQARQPAAGGVGGVVAGGGASSRSLYGTAGSPAAAAI